jgi:hypothetical protein
MVPVDVVDCLAIRRTQQARITAVKAGDRGAARFGFITGPKVS